ncbi:MAG: hypothetical protein PHD95_06685 [Candidatus ainarchaeum sp.]|nr:hypothetical protein [Candidatus ainarchaeum sp.]
MVFTVNEEVVVSTVKRMVDSGIEDKVIVKTLEDIGLGENEIRQYLLQVKGVPAQKETSHSQFPDDAQATQELLHTVTHNTLDEHSEKIDSLHQSVSGLHEKIDAISVGPSNQDLASQLALLNQKIFDLEKQVSDLKAMASASKSLLEKILEANRKIVEKL